MHHIIRVEAITDNGGQELRHQQKILPPEAPRYEPPKKWIADFQSVLVVGDVTHHCVDLPRGASDVSISVSKIRMLDPLHPRSGPRWIHCQAVEAPNKKARSDIVRLRPYLTGLFGATCRIYGVDVIMSHDPLEGGRDNENENDTTWPQAIGVHTPR